MKVIKRGEKPTWCKQYTCTGSGNGGVGCNSVLEVTIDDLVHWQGVEAESWGGSDPAYSWRCCVCGQPNDIPREDWPSRTAIFEIPVVGHQWYKRRNLVDGSDK